MLTLRFSPNVLVVFLAVPTLFTVQDPLLLLTLFNTVQTQIWVPGPNYFASPTVIIVA